MCIIIILKHVYLVRITDIQLSPHMWLVCCHSEPQMTHWLLTVNLRETHELTILSLNPTNLPTFRVTFRPPWMLRPSGRTPARYSILQYRPSWLHVTIMWLVKVLTRNNERYSSGNKHLQSQNNRKLSWSWIARPWPLPSSLHYHKDEARSRELIAHWEHPTPIPKNKMMQYWAYKYMHALTSSPQTHADPCFDGQLAGIVASCTMHVQDMILSTCRSRLLTRRRGLC